MNRLRHIAFSASDPVRLADMFVNLFGCTMLRADKRYAVVTDGYLFVSITHVPNRGADGTVDHLGFQVDDLTDTRQAAESAGLTETRDSYPATNFFTAMDGWSFEFREHGWAETIQAHTQLLDLAPVENEDTARLRPSPDVATVPADGFVRAGAAADLPPGTAVCVAAPDHKVLVVNVDGAYHAVSDACPHMPAFGRLSEGRRTGYEVECPVHCSRFDVRSGEVVEAPARRGVVTFETKVDDGDVWVRVDEHV